MSIPNHRIQDHASFQQVTGEPNQVAALYFFSALDGLVTLAARVAHDFFDRPHLYTDVDPSGTAGAGSAGLAPVIAALHARSGCHERFLSEDQRRQIYTGLFGASPGFAPEEDSAFRRLQRDFVNACSAFAERVFDTGLEMLRERVRMTHRPFKEYLTGLHGSSVRWSGDEALAGLTEDVAYEIMRNMGVAAVFGIARPPASAWPYVEDSNGDKLVEEISKQLMRPSEESLVNGGQPSARALWTPWARWTREGFSNLQRVASGGAVAIRTVLDFSDSSNDADLNRLVSKGYAWGSALMALRVPTAEPTGAAPMPTVDGSTVASGLPAEVGVYTP
jgi:hypothetical protein